VHGQKRRRKRSSEGRLAIDELAFYWQLLSEPLWSNEHGYKGLCISVSNQAGNCRGLVLEYPYPKIDGSFAPLPQRPKLNEKMIESDIRQAVLSGWDPKSRGKAFIYKIPTSRMESEPA
jgi:hypothetical protein